jgi:hypothetical protein
MIRRGGRPADWVTEVHMALCCLFFRTAPFASPKTPDTKEALHKPICHSERNEESRDSSLSTPQTPFRMTTRVVQSFPKVASDWK